MLPELNTLFQEMEKQKGSMLTRLQALSSEEQSRPPTPAEWSPLQVMSHVIAVEKIFEDVLPEEAKVLVQGHLFIAIGGRLMRFSTWSGLRIPTMPAFEPQEEHDFAALKQCWDKTRESLAFKLAAVTQDTVLLPFAMHPAVGPLNAKQFLRLLDIHLAYHLRHFPRFQK